MGSVKAAAMYRMDKTAFRYDRTENGRAELREDAVMGKTGLGMVTGKKIWVVLLLTLLLTVTAGCGTQNQYAENSPDRRLRIVCTIFPEYDWVRQILGKQTDETELILLMKNGADLHSYQPTVWDMKAISEADLLLYVGGESDFWVDEVLTNVKNPDCRSLNLMELLKDTVKTEEYTEGMQGHGHHINTETEEHSRHGDGELQAGNEEYDEHLWLSLRNAQVVCDAVTEALGEMDAEHRDIYEQNNRIYQERLHALDLEYTETVEQVSMPVLLFGDRFPFRYLMEDYGIEYYAAFAGCSAETEASFQTIAFLAEKAGELNLPAVMKIDGSDGAVARTVAGNTKSRDQKILLLDSMQSVSGQDMEDGESYLSIMERNLEVLKEALFTAE